MTTTAEDAKQVLREADCLYTGEQVEAAIGRMARDITAAVKDKNPLVLTVMTGGLVPAGRLLPLLEFPLQLDYIHATRYRNRTAGGELDWLVRPHTPLEGRAILILDDILDEGYTLAAILDYCREAGAAEVYSAVLVDKHHDRRHRGLDADFTGVEVDDRYVFGYGMDYKGFLRNAPGIYAVKGL